LRLHIGSADNPDFPSREVFPDFLQPELDAGKVIVDPTRFVVDDGLARLHRTLPYATLRPCGMAAVYFGADHLLAAVRVEHQAFYQRVFRHQLVCVARVYPHLSKPICLMTIDYLTVAEDAYRRYPFFRTKASEQKILFDRSKPGAVRWQAIPGTGRQAPGTDLDPPVEPAGAMTAPAARPVSLACTFSRWHAVGARPARAAALTSGRCERVAGYRADEAHHIQLKLYATPSATISEAWLFEMPCSETKLDQRGPQRRSLPERRARHRSRKLLRAHAVAPN
jgi:hypothetical protein